MEYNGAQLLVEALKAAGVKVLFGVSGSDTLWILDLIHGGPDIRYMQAQHEQGAMFMANGYARTARQAGISLVSPGPGATNSLTGVAQAFYTSTPSILICIEEGSRWTGMAASQHHDLDSLGVFRPVTKWAGKVSRIERLLESVHTAFRQALTGRKGPCYLGIHRDVLDRTIELERVTSPFPLPQPPRGNPADIEKLANLLQTAKRPAIIAGGGVYWSQAQDELLQLARILSAPIATTTCHKGLIPEDDPLSLGPVGTYTSPATIKAFKEADLLLAVGCSFPYFKAVFWSQSNKLIRPDMKIGHIDIDPGEIGKLYPADAAVVGDARLALIDLLEALRDTAGHSSTLHVPGRGLTGNNHAGSSWLEEIQKVKADWEKQSEPLKHSDQSPTRTWRLMADLRKALPREALVCGESGGTHGWFECAFQALTPNTIGGWHPLGAEVCEAMGAQVAAPDRPVVCITGDGSLMMTLSEIATAVANRIPVLWVIRHNGVYGNMRHTQLSRFGGRFAGTVLPIPNLANVARELGAQAERIDHPRQVIPAVERYLQSKQPTLLEVMSDVSPEELGPPRARDR